MYERHVASLAKGNTPFAECDKLLFFFPPATLPIIAVWREGRKAYI